jgi:hypothetical protein
LLIAFHFHQGPRYERQCKRSVGIVQKLSGELLKGGELVVPDIVTLVFCETMDKERSLTPFGHDQGAEPAGFSTPSASDSLLDYAAAEIGIDHVPLDIPHRLTEFCTRDPRLARETRKRFVLKNPHASSPVRNDSYYSTKCDILKQMFARAAFRRCRDAPRHWRMPMLRISK